MAQHEMPDNQGKLFGKIGNLFYGIGNDIATKRNVSDKPAGVGIGKTVFIGKLLYFSDINSFLQVLNTRHYFESFRGLIIDLSYF